MKLVKTVVEKIKATLPKIRTFAFKEGGAPPIGELILYLPVLLLTGALILLPLNLLRQILGYAPHTFYSAPYPLGELGRRAFSTVITILILSVGTTLCRRIFNEPGVASLGLKLNKLSMKEFAWGALAGLGFSAVFLIVELLCGWIRIEGFAWQSITPGTILTSLLIGILVSLESAFKEELLTRGYLLQTLEKWLNLPVAVLVAAGIFGAWHLLNPDAYGWLNKVIPISLTLLGLLLTQLYLVRRSLWLPIGFHFAWNLGKQTIFSLSASSPQNSTFLVTKVSGSELLIGPANSSFGPEVGLLGIAMIALCVILNYYMLKNGRQIWGREKNSASN